MTPVEFISDELFDFGKLFPSVTFKYGFNEIIKTHIVEISPDSEFYENSSLDAIWIPFSIHFQEIYPNEHLAFVPTRSDISPDVWQLEVNAKSLPSLPKNLFEGLTVEDFDYTFPTKISQGIVLESSLDDVLALPHHSIPHQIITEFEDDSIYLSAA